MAISAVAYLKATDENGHTHIGFVMGKSKLAPHPPHTVPRLELCGAVLAVEMAELITEELDPDMPTVLTPAMLLTQKVDPVLPPTGEYDLKDLYIKQWKQVQALADAFWKRWRQEYLVSLQPRRK